MRSFAAYLTLAGFLSLTSNVLAAPRAWDHPEETAIMSYDLGPSTIDVSKYPPNFRETYPLFLEKCSQCHSPARPINSPLTSEYDWSRFVSLMHARAQKQPLLTKKEGRQIIDFLVYDSQIRKVQNKTAFSQHQADLNAKWEALQKDRAHRAANHPVKESAPDTGTH